MLGRPAVKVLAPCICSHYTFLLSQFVCVVKKRKNIDLYGFVKSSHLVRSTLEKGDENVPDENLEHLMNLQKPEKLEVRKVHGSVLGNNSKM